MATGIEASPREGTALSVNASGQISKRSMANEQRFALTLSQRLKHTSAGRFISLADIVGRGNGYGTGTLNQGIDPVSGSLLQPTTPRGRSGPVQQFTQVPDCGYIDGLFVPNGQQGPIPFSSTGLQFERCPFTNSWFHDGIFYGANVGFTVFGDETGFLNQR